MRSRNAEMASLIVWNLSEEIVVQFVVVFLWYCQTDETLREHLAQAISVCCWYGNNRLMFGKEGTVGPLVGFLRATDNLQVQRATARALHQLSMCPENCVTMHRAGAIRVCQSIYVVNLL